MALLKDINNQGKQTGTDPLAWLDDDEPEVTTQQNDAATQKPQTPVSPDIPPTGESQPDGDNPPGENVRPARAQQHREGRQTADANGAQTAVVAAPVDLGGNNGQGGVQTAGASATQVATPTNVNQQTPAPTPTNNPSGNATVTQTPQTQTATGQQNSNVRQGDGDGNNPPVQELTFTWNPEDGSINLGGGSGTSGSDNNSSNNGGGNAGNNNANNDNNVGENISGLSDFDFDEPPDPNSVTEDDLALMEAESNAYRNPMADQMLDTYNEQQQQHADWLKEYADRLIPKEELERRERAASQIQGIANLGNILSAFGNLYHTRGGAPSQTLPEAPNADLAAWRKRQEDNLAKYMELQRKIGSGNITDLSKISTAMNTSARIATQIEKMKSDMDYNLSRKAELESRIRNNEIKTQYEKEKAEAMMKSYQAMAEYRQAQIKVAEANEEFIQAKEELARANAILARERAKTEGARRTELIARADAARTNAIARMKEATAKATKYRAEANKAYTMARKARDWNDPAQRPGGGNGLGNRAQR